jgi:hypothetical protein
MLKERTQAATMVADCLMPTEAAINATVGNLAALTTAMLNALTVGHLPIATGKDAFDKLGEATSLAFQIRAKALELHSSLNEARAGIGLREVGFGALQDCPPMKNTNGSDDTKVVRLVA